MNFRIEARDGRARTGLLSTDHGELATPAFMPVGTAGCVKTLESREVKSLGAQIVLANAYHLYLRPGTEVLRRMGGLHRFMNWSRPILVDSGGYQVFSLAKIRELSEVGVHFRSHIDGSPHLFTPERVIEIQRIIGADLVMPLDDLVGWPVDKDGANIAAERTWRWLERGLEAMAKSEPLYGYEQTLLPIVQGSFYPELRKREAERLAALDAPAYAIGGLAVGETFEMRAEAMDIATGILPEDRPRYTMGIGLPADLLDAVGRGIDLFDCVVPTRNGRNASVFTRRGRMNMRNAIHAVDERPVEIGCSCPCCARYSRAYLHHLFHSREILALKLATAHNLRFYFTLLEDARIHITRGDFRNWSGEILRAMEPPETEPK